MQEIKRWAAGSVEKALGIWRCVYVAGARQCGKTTLVRQCEGLGMEYRTLDDAMLLRVARSDPAGFVHRSGRTLVVDEVQKAPELLPEIKMAVDRNGAKGQYLLTGSAHLPLLPAVTESLAGRMGTIRLRTLAEGEVRGVEPTFVARAFGRDFPATVAPLDRRGVLELAMRGGYPETMELAPAQRRRWFHSYLDALLLHDIRQLMDVRAYGTLRALAEAMLARSARFFTDNELSTALSVKHETLVRFQTILKMLFLVEEVPAWTEGDYDGVVKRSKWFASDTGMMASVLGWRADEVFLDDDRSGKAVESWVHHELSAQADAAGGLPIYHYRDQKKREIDFILESDDGALVGIEVKAGSAVRTDDFKYLNWFRDNLAKGRPFTGVVLHSGRAVARFGEGNLAVPLSALCS
jgi:predicted AAA+ superfamily ATPase